MPPKFDPTKPEVAALIKEFEAFGLSTNSATELVRTPKAGNAFRSLVDENGLAGKSFGNNQANALVKLSAVSTKLSPEARKYVLNRIVAGDLKSPDQVAASVKYLEKSPSLPVDTAAFDKASGVEHAATLSFPPKSWSDQGPFLGGIKNSDSDLKWAPTADLKAAVDAYFTEVFGSRESASKAKGEAAAASKAKAAKEPKKKAAAPKPAETTYEASTSNSPYIPTRIFQEGFLSEFHKVGGNPQISLKLKEEHLKWTGGQVYTRFPPEPNGYLHIGHVKAIMIDFGYAKFHNGRTYLRYDDTNPEAEEGKYFQSILETVRWLGFEPWKVTYSSDNFDKLYALALDLTKRGGAYICFCDAEKIKADRGGGKGNPVPCEHRDRSIEDNVRDLEKMKNGVYKEGEACLRMKMDLTSGNPYMWDTVAYRVKNAPHHRTGDKWKIYPTYDFTHCLCDSFENITHSLCTTEFVSARQSYEWLCDAVEVYKPRQYEFARLNLQGTFLSKRKVRRLVEHNLVKSWDDPRLYTIIALRRRGIPPGALLAFVSELGVTTLVSETQLQKFESTVRRYLEDTAPRLMMVLKPIKLIIDNVPDDYKVPVQVPLHPKVPAMGSVETMFTKEVYIDAEDFRTEDSPDYFRLAPGKSVGLFKAPFPVTCTSFKTDSNGNVTEIHCNLDNEGEFKKPKAYIQWVQAPGAVHIDEVRYFHPLFKHDPPPKDFESDVNPDSIEVFTGAVVEPAFYELAKKETTTARAEAHAHTQKAATENEVANDEAKPADHVPQALGDEPVVTADQLVGMENIRFQAMRLAYFAVDSDSKLSCLDEAADAKPGKRPGDKIVLNRIVSLKEDAGKKA
ncbi:uncharacterized protein CcaverHIS019_0407240 [Cutaneotrichosporon cavernicola]|uniref:glutamine--tRNA ligase n=1 Tax=Cutaneotrichosporon cavernicola TaxID=279322 RepID=A0AA48QW02_9TREE|nr:uncharacterized protein CcaverHIS019_0407240 [Cutaneotrichosporon cavernicola]BEI91904.1 hypothetical protein CcaverHIS019_0407240 [Cutaneotrichosporon cavernicola]